MAFLGQEEQVREFQDRFKYVHAVVLVAMGILLVRLVVLQIFKGEEMRRLSEDNRIKRVKIASPRGMIFDRNHKLLIDNRPAFDLEITPQFLRQSKQTVEVVSLLSRLIKMPQADIYETLEKAKTLPAFMPVKIKSDLSRDEVAAIESWRLSMPGVAVIEEIKRTNVFGDIASHLFGYIGEVNSSELPLVNKQGPKYKLGDSIGKAGLEQRLEDTIRGIDGEKLVEVDALGRTKLEKSRGRVLSTDPEKPALPGKNLILTIDQDLQLATVKAFGDKIGAAVAIDPRTGEILAMVSRPSYATTEFSRGIPAALWQQLLQNEDRPLRDKTVQDHYSPGSVFKTITAIAGLEEGVIDENTKINCPGRIWVGNRPYHCHKKEGHGGMNVVSALTQSCDIFFYRVAQKLKSVDDIAKWANHVGLGKKTGIDLAHEIPGLIPTEAWKQKRFKQAWNPGESLSVAIGQGFVLTTPLQLALSFGAIGNGAALWKPFVLKEIESFDGQVLQEFKPSKLAEVSLKPKTLELVKQGLWGVVNSPHGTGYSQRLPGMDFSGKTGTIQLRSIAADKIYYKCENMKFRDRHNGAFAGYAPAKDPVIAVGVLGEHVCHGATGAAPIARAIIKTYLEKYYPDLYGEKVLAARLKKEGRTTHVPKTSGDEDEGVTDIPIPNSEESLELKHPPPVPEGLTTGGGPSESDE